MRNTAGSNPLLSAFNGLSSHRRSVFDIKHQRLAAISLLIGPFSGSLSPEKMARGKSKNSSNNSANIGFEAKL